MKRVFVASTILLALVVALFIGMEVRNQHRLNNIPEPVAANPMSVSTKPVAVEVSGDYEAMQARNEIMAEWGVTAQDLEDLSNMGSDEQKMIAELYGFNNLEGCCPEDELIEGSKKRRKVTLEDYLDKYIPKGFTRSEIERYFYLSSNILTDTSLGMADIIELFELDVRFEPNEVNIRNYNKFMKSIEGVPLDSWKVAERNVARK